ncbi:PP2C family protein-serine/threonine phosphatase [Streptomyces sp. SP18CS02]|uniref:PP2C family protein-serine/threonine phosphatase n=1 Tax=Streptomyces sp. SP18CS02 TaxID=3002531 RepID=UPI002E767C8D|nr:PP2C family protein-serine/threonine phosphatase [Streptomyces sp. SP18CS02]MEE1751315.1 PP2C family protein-serine/threonine phosphatase [Streptomyces sp. SP18CS02]
MDRGAQELPGASTPRWLRLLPWLTVALLVIVQLTTPRSVQLGFAFAVVPPLTSLVYAARGTALVSAALGALLLLPVIRADDVTYADLLAFVLISAVSVVLARLRTRREAQLVSVRTVAEAAQLAVLPPLPERVGPVRCGALYRAAERGALVGGDLYDVQQGPFGVRAVVADVRGHGMAAVSTVAALLGTFREAVLDERELGGVAARLDRRLVVDSAGREAAELFATAVLMEFAPDGSAVRVLSCGHPAPVLVAGGGAREVALVPGSPLGLGLADYRPPAAVTVPLLPSDVLLAHTDGVTEARDASGRFYPLATRIKPGEPVDLVRAVWRDLSAYAGEIDDDVALLALRASDGTG